MKQLGAGVRISGSGSAVPQANLSNQEISRIVETSHEWISTRTGITQRHLAAPDESLVAIATKAATQALEMARVAASEVELIILATSSPDDLFGSAAEIQTALGANRAVAFDLTAACSGFLFALVTASQYIRTGVYRKVLVIGADVLSRWVDWSDRSTCILFGDGAGAVVLEADGEVDNLLGFELCSDGTQNYTLKLAHKGTPQTLNEKVTVSKGAFQPITMNGREVYRFAVAKVPEVVAKALFRANLEASEVDWLLLHQANQRILDAVAKRLKIPPEKVISNLANYGNTSAASIPLALDEAVREGKIQPGDIIASSGFGAGLTWGAAIFKWG